MKRFGFSLMTVMLLVAAPAWAQKPSTALRNGVKLAANLQLSREQSWANGDSGVGTYTCSWEWEVGTGTAYANTQGPSVLGLLKSAEAFDRNDYLRGAVCAAQQMILRYDADTTKRPYADDVIFLSKLSEVTRNRFYQQRAVTYHARTRAQYSTGTALADHYINDRLSLAGWDLSSQIEAALAVEQDAYAKAIALQIIARRADWEGVPYYDGADYTLLSRATLVGAMAELEGRSIKSYRDDSRQLALTSQDSDGSWEGDYQTTAYVLMGLERSPQSESVKKATAGGAKYLLATETSAGGWSYPPEFGEVNGEVLSALASVVRQRHDWDREREFREPKQHNEHGHARPHREDWDR